MNDVACRFLYNIDWGSYYFSNLQFIDKCSPHLQSANRQIHKLVNSVFSAKEEMFLSNLHGLAGGSLIFTEQTEFTKFRICEFAYLKTVCKWEQNVNNIFNFNHSLKSLFSKNVPNFWWLCLKPPYKISKNPLSMLIGK